MKRTLYLVLSCILIYSCGNNFVSKNQDEYLELVEKASTQLQYLTNQLNNGNKTGEMVFPRSLNDVGEIKFVGKQDWTSGFYPGVLWMMYELTGKNSWKNEAVKFTGLLESEKFNSTNHDLGFKMMSSFGHGYRLTNNPEYKDILIQSARTLIKRFNENVGCIRSWDHHKDKWDFPVIIDNIMNLELLFFAWHETGEPVFYNIAVAHAETTMKNHFRTDYSTFHVLSYDTITGEVVARNTHQGFSNESCWARGQAWALYGYTMIYRETHNPEYLIQAEKIAEYILNQPGIKDGKVPHWDFNAPYVTDEPCDASAAAIITSALFELSSLSDHKEIYFQTANKLLTTLSSSEFFGPIGENKGFLLKHSTGSKPANSEVDVPLIYADYYYLEALKRKIEIYESIDKLINN